MAEFMVELSHTDAECTQAVDEVMDRGSEILSKVAWGCPAGTHIGWARIQAANADEARNMVTGSVLRPKARVTEVTVHTAEELRKMHAA